MKIEVGTSVMMKLRDIDEKIREGEIRGMRKDQASALKLPLKSISLLLSSYLAATRGSCIFFWVPFLFQSATKTKPDYILWIVVNEEMEMVPLLFKWVLFVITLFICIKKGLLLLFQNCLNVAIM